ncbi:hypothetical protein [Streptococcus dysgalactiae]|uniref:hypothetical protein n=1 Tax=Streptococcus dysgalactiae TaxID=1334 RepID=UPI00194DD376|nr:hypothetical protein [Streptococcus dysgalactiae]
MAPTDVSPYDALRDELLKRTAMSEEKRLQHFLSGIQLDSLIPSVDKFDALLYVEYWELLAVTQLFNLLSL